MVSGWPDAVEMAVAVSPANDTYAALEGQRSTPYAGPGQAFSGLVLLASAGSRSELTVTARLPDAQPGGGAESAVSASVLVAVAPCGPTEAFDPSLRRCACPTGSSRAPSGSCRCSDGFHSFTSLPPPGDPSSSLASVSCRPCRAAWPCVAGLVSPASGYWHSSPESEDFQRCPTAEACSGPDRGNRLIDLQRAALAASASSGDLEGASITQLAAAGLFPLGAYAQAQCGEGYEGPLCARCARGFGRFSSLECRRCPAASTGRAVLAFLLFLYLGLVLLSVRLAFFAASPAGRGAPHAFALQAFKVLVSYHGCQAMLLSLATPWPEPLRGVLRWQSVLGNAADGLYSFDCLRAAQGSPFFDKLLVHVTALPFEGLLVPALAAAAASRLVRWGRGLLAPPPPLCVSSSDSRLIVRTFAT